MTDFKPRNIPDSFRPDWADRTMECAPNPDCNCDGCLEARGELPLDLLAKEVQAIREDVEELLEFCRENETRLEMAQDQLNSITDKLEDNDE